MTSLQLVEFINHLRKQDGNAPYVELLHKDFMGKIPKVLKAVAIQFTTAFYEVNNAKRERQIAIFEKREAMLMAMSYSYDIQAVVYDAWETAEKALFERVVLIAPVVKSHVANEDYADALKVLASVRTEVDQFFAEVMVNVDEPLIRANRLGLLKSLFDLLNAVADISRLGV